MTRQIIGAAIEVHRVLGPGLLESTYLSCLTYELTTCGLRHVTQQAIPIAYKGMLLDAHYRVDLIVEGSVIVEIKAVDRVVPVHQAQLLTYLKLTGCAAGLLTNFNVAKLVDGVRRVTHPLLYCGDGGSGERADERIHRRNGEMEKNRSGMP